MAEAEQVPVQEEEEEDDANKVAYKPPAEKSITQIMQADQDDEALNKYKQTLLGQGGKVLFPDNPNHVILSKMCIVTEGRADKEIDLSNVNNLKKEKFIVKEGAQYKLKILFYVQREIVSGLKFVSKVSRKVLSKKLDYMVGSYAPSEKLHEYVSTLEEFPSGMISRGTYDVHSVFVDDDKKEALAWDWKFEIKKDWED